MKICEVFRTISGEGSTQGQPATFIRTYGCNLNCWGGCDTPYAMGRDGKFETVSVDELVKRISVWPRNVIITGGEPLLQKDELRYLCESLRYRGHSVLIETNGSIPLESMDEAIFDMDYKLPSTGMEEKMVMANLEFLRPHDELKFVIKDRLDFDRALDILSSTPLKCKVYMSPYWEEDGRDGSFATLAENILVNELDVTYSIQLHKCIWSPQKRGV